MAKKPALQITLRPQDLYAVLALLTRRGQPATYRELAAQTGLAESAVHGAFQRAALAGLLMFQAPPQSKGKGRMSPVVLKPQLKEFLVHGAKYAFPPQRGGLTRGVPTAYAAEPLSRVIAPSADPAPVWPHAQGTVRGLSLTPLSPAAPAAALRDASLYALLALFDALRAGQARERNAAQELLESHFE
jgi:hypothetical protein